MSEVYVNRTLNLKKIKYIGVDMDHTLVRYNADAFEKLAYESMKAKLIDLHKYPEEISALKFDFKHAIRGLVIDKNYGNLLKVTRYGEVRECFNGLEKMNFKEIKERFSNQIIDLNDHNFASIDTAFSISHACLFMQLVELKKQKPELNLPEFSDLSSDLYNVLDLSHKDGTIKNEVTQNLKDYVLLDEELVQNILRYKKHGKVFFIVTNSDFTYTKCILDYAINPFLPEGQTWSDLFTFTFTFTLKPRFFYNRLPLLKIDKDTGFMKNWESDLVPGVYQGGYAELLTNHWDAKGEDILYVGDHIYGDILRLKKDCAWKTALVIEELDDEVKNSQKSADIIDELHQLMVKKVSLEGEIDEIICTAIENQTPRPKAKLEPLQLQVQNLDEKMGELIQKQRSQHNSLWGEIMRTGVEESHFANQVERFADIYMSQLSDLLRVSPRSYFRKRKRLMAHDQKEEIELEGAS